MQHSDSGSLSSRSVNQKRSGTGEVESQELVVSSRKMKKEKLTETRYFIIKSLSHENIQLSVKKGIWATQTMNERILEEAFQNSRKVILIFSVNMSGYFQGYAQMTSSFGWRRDNMWSQGSGKNNHWGRSFKVKWLCLHDLPFQKTLHLKNPWNEFKPVKISRDCQELPVDIGKELCELFDHAGDLTISVKGDECSGNEAGGKHAKQQPQLSHNGSVGPTMQMPPVFYPNYLWQQSDTFQSAYPTVEASCRNSLSVPHTNDRGFSTERIIFDGTFSEDDFLEMDYEDYLKAYSRGAGKMLSSAAVPTQSFPKSSSSRERSEDSQTGSSGVKKRKH